MDQPVVVTAVVGAGPAGLLFCIASTLLWGKQGGDRNAWSILLFDKRTEYQRTHRLRIAPERFRALQAAVDDPRFDEIVRFLDGCRFSPTVNELEARLAALSAELGVTKHVLDVGTGPGRVAVHDLRAHLEAEGLVPGDACFTIVGADSVHSDVRAAVGGDRLVVDHTHQTVARLRVTGDGLPHRLGKLDAYRISKVLGSVVDYRLNPNGFAEVDAFLDGPAHERLGALGATPASPLLLDADLVDQVGSPLFARLVEHLAHGLTDGDGAVALQSTFRLEHRYVEQLTFDLPAVRTQVFLVGDAAVSLPFFRGMACLVGGVHQLALAQCALVTDGDGMAARARYEREAGAVRRTEVATVRSRARLVKGAREFARVSSLLPFPLQTWFLSIPDARRPGRWSAGVVLAATLAILAASSALGAMAFTHPGLGPGALWWTGVAIQAVGGLTYRAAQEFEPGPDTALRAVWRVQIAAVFVVGIAVAVVRWSALTLLLRGVALTSWFLLGVAFIAGMEAYDAIGAHLVAGARLDDDVDDGGAPPRHSPPVG
jgi:hypothetical protein